MSSTDKVFLDFQFGFKLMFIFALLVFKVHQHLDPASTSSTFKLLELVVVIVTKSTIVGITIVGMVLLVWDELQTQAQQMELRCY